jgi:hypothetical protein
MELLSPIDMFEFSRVMNAVAAGQTAQTSSKVDARDADGVCFLVAFGTITAGAVTSIKIQQSDDDGSTDGYSDLAGSSVSVPDTASNKIVPYVVKRPLKGDLKLVISRGTQNAVIDGVTAFKFNLRKVPATQPSTVAVSKTLVGPAEGTA